MASCTRTTLKPCFLCFPEPPRKTFSSPVLSAKVPARVRAHECACFTVASCLKRTKENENVGPWRTRPIHSITRPRAAAVSTQPPLPAPIWVGRLALGKWRGGARVGRVLVEAKLRATTVAWTNHCVHGGAEQQRRESPCECGHARSAGSAQCQPPPPPSASSSD